MPVSERHASIKTYRSQRPYGDTYYRAEVDFEYDASDFGGSPSAEDAIKLIEALWPTARRVDFEMSVHPNAEHVHIHAGVEYADKWIGRGKAGFNG